MRLRKVGTYVGVVFLLACFNAFLEIRHFGAFFGHRSLGRQQRIVDSSNMSDASWIQRHILNGTSLQASAVANSRTNLTTTTKATVSMSVLGKQRKPIGQHNTNKSAYDGSLHDLELYLSNKNKSVSTANECSKMPSMLVGKLKIDINKTTDWGHEQFKDIQSGGLWKPSSCVARQRIAIIIPYRDRPDHLRTLLYYLIPVLKRQLLDFQIFVVEQYGNQTFNKGRVMNAGFKEAWRHGEFDCFVFHDVDMVPENDKNMYTCHDEYPKHMSPAVDKFKYRLPYLLLVGGVLSMRPEVFMKVNGYSNMYWGWGAEDDDMAYRIKKAGLEIYRPDKTYEIGRYKMIIHKHRENVPAKISRYLLKNVGQRYVRDGLNSVKYTVKKTENQRLYTLICVDVGNPPKNRNAITKHMA